MPIDANTVRSHLLGSEMCHAKEVETPSGVSTSHCRHVTSRQISGVPRNHQGFSEPIAGMQLPDRFSRRRCALNRKTGKTRQSKRAWPPWMAAHGLFSMHVSKKSRCANMIGSCSPSEAEQPKCKAGRMATHWRCCPRRFTMLGRDLKAIACGRLAHASGLKATSLAVLVIPPKPPFLSAFCR